VEYAEPEKMQDQAYMIRLVPSNVRASYNTNPAFPKHDHMKLAESVAKHYAEIMRIGLCHTSMHPENILFTGSRYVLTDMADARMCNEIEDFDNFLRDVLSLIEEVPGIPEQAVLHFYNTLRNELEVSVGQK
jgi:tRNA A-37 threonylcarbamoyl transferase component Bud32